MGSKSKVNLCVKYVLFFVNWIIWLVAAALVIICTYVLVLKEKFVRDAMDFFMDPACFLTLIGSIAVALTMFGFMGSLRENTTCISIYHYIVALLLLLQVAGAVLLFVLYWVPDAQTTLNMNPGDALKDAILKYRDDADLESLINAIQEDLQCCGFSNDDSGYKDWNNNMYFNCSAGNPSFEACSVPFSCCKLADGEAVNLMCGSETQSKQVSEVGDQIFTRGCVKAIRQWIDDNAPLVGGITLGVIVPQIFLIYLARKLQGQINEQWYIYHREQRAMSSRLQS